MKRFDRMLLAVLFGALAGLSVPATAWAQTRDEHAAVSVRFVSHRPNSAPGAGNSVGESLSPTEMTRFFVVSGKADAEGPCGGVGVSGVSAERQTALEAGAMYVWRFEVRMIEVVIDKITFDLTWERIAQASNESIQKTTRRLTLREGETYPIDIVRGRPGSTCVSFFLEATANIRETPALANKTIEWDMWWQIDANTPPVQTRSVSRQGEAVTFAFEPVALTPQSAGSQPAELKVAGQVRGRVRADGTIDVALDTRRTVTVQRFVEVRGTGSGAGAGAGAGSGQKIFTIKPEEVVRIVVPALSQNLRITDAQGNAISVGEMAITIRARVR